MIGTRAQTLSPDDLQSAAEALLTAGGRVRFAYAWSPAESQVEVRYIASVPDQREFEMWVVKGFRELPSLAAIFPSLGWYEREMMDLNGLRFLDHPEPYPLVLKDSGQELMNAVPAATGRPRLPHHRRCRRPAVAVRADPRPMCSSPPSSRSSMSANTSSITSRGSSSSIGAWRRCFEGADPQRAVVTAERVSAVGSVAHALAYCEAVERAAGLRRPGPG